MVVGSLTIIQQYGTDFSFFFFNIVCRRNEKKERKKRRKKLKKTQLWWWWRFLVNLVMCGFLNNRLDIYKLRSQDCL